MTHNHAIEQAVKAFEHVIDYGVDRMNGSETATLDLSQVGKAYRDLRAMQQEIPPQASVTVTKSAHANPAAMNKHGDHVSDLHGGGAVKTDEELAHHLASQLADTIEGVACGDELHRYLVPDLAIPLITQAFAAIRKKARDEALELAAAECDRHAKFCKSEARNGGDYKHLMTRYDEAIYNAEQIRKLKATK